MSHAAIPSTAAQQQEHDVQVLPMQVVQPPGAISVAADMIAGSVSCAATDWHSTSTDVTSLMYPLLTSPGRRRGTAATEPVR